MKIANLYRKIFFLFSFLVLGVVSAQAQLDLKLQLMPDGTTWGVYVKPVGITPTTTTITGSGQVTLVSPTGYFPAFPMTISSQSGTWQENARVSAPTENPSRDYLSIGFITDNPQIIYQAGTETLLFTFSLNGACPDSLYIIDNATDPFIPPPGGANSANTNPGNDLSVIDLLAPPPNISAIRDFMLLLPGVATIAMATEF